MSSSADAASVVDTPRVDVARAVIASLIAAQNDLQVVAVGEVLTEPPESPLLAVSPWWPLGYPMVGELVALEKLSLSSGDDAVETAGPDPGTSGLTHADQTLSGVTAFLFDRLVNPVLPLQVIAPPPNETISADRVYGEALRTAQFAGDVLTASPARQEAERLLFETGADGNRTRTSTYETYRSFAEQVRAARDALETLGPDATARSRNEAQAAVDRLDAEWLALGHKEAVETAIDVMLTESRNAGFEDERIALLDRLEAMQRLRLDQVGETYCLSQLAPVAPLLADAGDHDGWRQVDLDAAQVRETLHVDLAAAYGLVGADLTAALDGLRTLSVSYTTVDVVRDWLDQDFFATGFWRLPDGEKLSDGVGGGTLPGYPGTLLFVRSAVVDYADGLVAAFGDEPGGPQVVRTLRLQSTRSAKLSVLKALRVAQESGLHRSATALRLERAASTDAAPPVAPTAEDGQVVRSPVARLLEKGAATALLGRGPSLLRARTPQGVISRVSTLLPRERALPRPAAPGGRVRDHRDPDASPRPRVRDHRSNPGQPDKPLFPLVRFDVGITAPDPSLLAGLSVQLDAAEGMSVSVPLQVDPVGVLSGEVRTRVKESTQVTVTLRGPDQVMDERRVSVLDDEIDLTWDVTERTARLEIIPSAIPTLFGYAITVVPACPTPDPDLTWT